MNSISNDVGIAGTGRSGELFLTREALDAARVTFDYARPCQWDAEVRKLGLQPDGFVWLYPRHSQGGGIESRPYPVTPEAVAVYNQLWKLASRLI